MTNHAEDYFDHVEALKRQGINQDGSKCLLIGPVPYITRKRICCGKEIVTFVPDYSKQGVKERIAAEVDLIEAECWVKGRK